MKKLTVQSLINSLIHKKVICYITFVTDAEFSIDSSELDLTLEDVRFKSKSFTTKKVEALIVGIDISAESDMFETGGEIYITMSLEYNDVVYEIYVDLDEELHIV